jgi:hypothetical protein
MRRCLLAAVLVLPALARPALAHRLDEYLQAAVISLEKDHVAVQLHLTPGVAVFGKVFGGIDTDGDGVISAAEERAYAEHVRGDLALSVDGHRSQLRLVSAAFPAVEKMKEGLGDIVLNFETSLPPGGFNRELTFENHHQSGISVYLVNCLVPRDPDIRVTAQDRNYDQSYYRLNYTQAGGGPDPPHPGSSQGISEWGDRTGSTSLFEAYVYQGIHHILTGYDHLLFASALVLAATTLWEVVKVVFTFTLAHSITLALAALNVIHLPERVVEPLISASIVFVALQNVFWPRNAKGWSRLGAAFFFGLFHGLGFAGGLMEAMQQMPGATMLLAILAFSVGVEAGHQMVVLPLFAVLKAARHTQPDADARARISMRLQRIGSAGIMIFGVYYLCLALGKS